MNNKKYHYLYLIQFIVLITLSSLSFDNSGEKSTLIEINSQKLKSYILTHGKILNESLFSPYASEYAKIEKIDTVKIVNQIIGRLPIEHSNDIPTYISSYRYLCGDWTYFMSNSVGVYEVLKVKDTTTNSIYIAVLYNNPNIEEITKLNRWHLSIFNEDVGLISSFDLENKKPFDFVPGDDMIYTDLRVVKGSLIVVITYTQTGSGGFPERGQLFRFSIVANNFKLVESLPVKDGSKKNWLE